MLFNNSNRNQVKNLRIQVISNQSYQFDPKISNLKALWKQINRTCLIQGKQINRRCLIQRVRILKQQMNSTRKCTQLAIVRNK